MLHTANNTANTSIKNERELIVGGEEALSNQCNWFVSIGNRAGVLIAPQFFITKANYVPFGVRVRGQMQNWSLVQRRGKLWTGF